MIITRPVNISTRVQARWSDTESGYYLIRWNADTGALRRLPEAFSAGDLYRTLDDAIAAHDTGAVKWMTIP